VTGIILRDVHSVGEMESIHPLQVLILRARPRSVSDQSRGRSHNYQVSDSGGIRYARLPFCRLHHALSGSTTVNHHDAVDHDQSCPLFEVPTDKVRKSGTRMWPMSPMQLGQGPAAEPYLACLFHLSGCKPKPVRLSAF